MLVVERSVVDTDARKGDVRIGVVGGANRSPKASCCANRGEGRGGKEVLRNPELEFSCPSKVAFKSNDDTSPSPIVPT